jgi:hypothetical protein
MQCYLLPKNKDCPDMALELRQAVYDEEAGWYLHSDLLGLDPSDTIDLVFGRDGECVSLTDKQFDRRVPLVSVNIAREKNMVSEAVEKTLDEFIEWLGESLV